MKKSTIILILTTLILFQIQQVEQKKLRFVINLFRHGARGTLHGTYLNNTTPLDEYWAGQLTGVGQREHYLLGKQFRKEYIEEKKFLSESMNFQEINIYSTSVNRTLQSAASQLAGLYPMGTGPLIKQNIQTEFLLPPYKGANQYQLNNTSQALPQQFQSIPIHAVENNDDAILFPQEQCTNFMDKYEKWRKEPKQQKVWDDMTIQLQKQKKQIDQILYQDVGVYYYNKLRDNIDSNLWNDLPGVPEELMPGTDLYNAIKYSSDYYSFWKFGDKKMHQLLNTHLFQYWIDLMDNALKNKSPLKWQSLSAHDSNLQLIMPALGLTSLKCINDQYFQGHSDSTVCLHKPRFATGIIIEIYEKKKGVNNLDNGIVKLKYDGEYYPVCPSGKIECEYREFKKLLKDQLIPQKEYDKYCFSKDENKHSHIKDKQKIKKNKLGEQSLLNKFIVQENNNDKETIDYKSIIIIEIIAILGAIWYIFKNRSKKSIQNINNNNQYQEMIQTNQ